MIFLLISSDDQQKLEVFGRESLRGDQARFSEPAHTGTSENLEERNDEIIYDFCRYILPGGDLGARSAESVGLDSATSPPKDQQFANGSNHVGGGCSLRGDRCGAAVVFQAAG